MKMRRPVCAAVLHAIVTFFLSVTGVIGLAGDVSISHISPRKGSLAGHTRITIFGIGFERNQFTFEHGAAVLGGETVVDMVSDTRVFPCKVHKDSSHETQIVCYTVDMPTDYYMVRVYVAGCLVPEENHCPSNKGMCIFKPAAYYTPRIVKLRTFAGPPKRVVSMRAVMMTDIYGQTTETATNGRKVEVKRVYNNGQLCNLRVGNTDELYQLKLDSEVGHWGNMDCMTGGSYVGNQNFSFIISGAFGRSSVDGGALKLTSLNTLAMYQTYAQIYNVTPSVGSVAGGTPLTIYGQNFDETDAPAEVLVGEEPCEVTEVTPTRIVCLTPPEVTSTIPGFSGNRGWKMDVYARRSLFYKSMEEIANLTNPTYTLQLDGASYVDEEMDYYVGVFKGYFVPPKASEYRFLIKGDFSNHLYLSRSENPREKRLIATAGITSQSYYKESSQVSDKIFLENDRRYYMEVAFKERRGHASCKMAALMLNTDYSNSQSDHIIDEQQIISIRTRHQNEVKVLSFDNWTTQSSSTEVQVVEVTSDFPSDATFRLGMFGVYTEPLMIVSSATTVQAALDKLVTIPYGVQVSLSPTTSGSTFTITYRGDTGRFPLLKVGTDSSANILVNSSVSRSTEGVPSMRTVVLLHEGLPSSPILYEDLNIETVAKAIKEIHSVRCPSEFLAAPRAKYFQDYENGDRVSYNPLLGELHSETRPFCGRYSMKNPEKIFTADYTSVMVDSNKYLCFAYLGHPYSHLKVQYLYNAHGATNLERYHAVEAGLNIHIEWSFVCLDLLRIIKDESPRASFIRVQDISIFVREGDLYVDTVYLGPLHLTQDIEGINNHVRLVPTRWLLDEVAVTGTKETGFEISFTSLYCQTNIGPIGVAFGNETMRSHNITEFRSPSWPALTMAVSTRNQQSSPPVTGTFDISYENQTIYGVSLETTSYEMSKLLETLKGTGRVRVNKQGHCAGYDWTVTFHTAGGNHPQMEVDVSNLQGTGVEGEVRTVSDGGAMFDTIPGDLLRTYHETPQVTVKINRIPSRCEGDCGFDWSENQTPIVSSFSPTRGHAGTVLTITGIGFISESHREIQVTIAGVNCDVTSVSTTEIQCTIGQGLSGAHNVMVTVLSMGLARDNSGGQFSYLFEVNNISPLSGSNAGGTVVTLSGGGFTDNVTVSVGSGNCEITFNNASTLICITPKGSRSATIHVTGGSQREQVGNFAFTNPQAVVKSISPMKGIVGGTKSLTVTGRNFGDWLGVESVILGGRTLEIKSWSDTEIEAVLPSMTPGSYDLEVYAGEHGFADVSDIGAIVYTLVVNAMEPRAGSINGGTIVTIAGEGFPEDEDVDVRIGNTECHVTSVSSGEITCMTEAPGTLHVVRNTGKSPEFGAGYSWEPMVVDALVGEFVLWEWTTAHLVTSVEGYIIEQTQTASSKSYTGGFQSSTTKARNGKYQHQFNSPGTYYYWSNRIDTDGTIDLRGVVNVYNNTVHHGDLSVHVGGFQADIQVAKTGKIMQKHRRRSKTLTTDQICSLVEPCDTILGQQTTGSHLRFAFANCATPAIDDIYNGGQEKPGKRNAGTIDDTLTILGSGFGDADCQNDIYVGGWPCPLLTSSNSKLECRPGIVNSDMKPGEPYSVRVYVKGVGEALNTISNDIDKTFTVIPTVSDIHPTHGSLLGGTRITLTGFGFNDGTSVTILGTPCVVGVVSRTHIICIASRAWRGTSDVDVNVINSKGQRIAALCVGTCTYTYSAAFTPVVHYFTPTTITAEVTTVNIIGTGLLISPADEVSIYVGETECTVKQAGGNQVECELSYPIAGDDVRISVGTPRGYASFAVSNTIRVPLVLSSIKPSAGSTEGGTHITLTGLGFDPEDSAADGLDCDIIQATRKSVVCKTASGVGREQVSIRSRTLKNGGQPFEYTTTYTPIVTTVRPASARSGDMITLIGENLGIHQEQITVFIDTAECMVISASSTELRCIVGPHSAGTFAISVDIQPFGNAICQKEFTYELSVYSIYPSAGSFGGDQAITIYGNGFDDTKTNIVICDQVCEALGTPSISEIVCKTRAHSGSGRIQCHVIVEVIGRSKQTIQNGYLYEDSLTAIVNGVTPHRGGTGGGTALTITGAGFGSDQSATKVTIAGSECLIKQFTSTEIVCKTTAHMGSVETFVRVEILDNGIAKPISAYFEYVDLWSSTWTWGGNDLPVEGDFVIIPPTMTVVLDTDTPIFKMLIIQGGRLIFDETDITLNAEVILITDGGLLQVGTEEEPFQHSATIMMHGHVRSKELPIYGSKTLAVREGTLDLHGIPVGTTWTRFADTASAGDSFINLERAVQWPIGSEIVIASTGDAESMIQNEKRRIVGKSNAGRTLTLDSPLKYQHLGETVDVTDGVTLEARAEVGLLSHNIVVRGSDDDQWHDKIDACKAGFDTGEFAMQTCFQGRFDEEIGSNQFGAQIKFHAPEPDKGLVVGRIENVEITYAGQALRIGRYAIHFHLNGNMQGSYVRSCSVHKSFNRAVNIHGTHQVLVEHTVAFDIMGGAFFLEDGIETGNIWQYNLAVFVQSSTSLQNADITPAAFWVTNPNNTVRHNAAAGGSHFGFWYRLQKHPEGASSDDQYCTKNVQLGEFFNNTVHSQGWFGLWIFPSYYPMYGGTLESGTCQVTEPAVANFERLITWNCDKGAEASSVGSVHFSDFVAVNNRITGIEIKHLAHHLEDYGEKAPRVLNSVIAAEAGILDSHTSRNGIVLPLARGLKIVSVTFVNYQREGHSVFQSAEIIGKSSTESGGFTHYLQDIAYINSPNKAFFRWKFDTVLFDVDGTTTGIAGGKALPTMHTLPTPGCTEDAAFSRNVHVSGSVCMQSIVLHRFSFNNPNPSTLSGRNVVIKNRYGTDGGSYQRLRLTHPFGWMVLLVDGEVTDLHFEDSQQIANMSYHGIVYDLKESDYVIIGQNLTQRVDVVTITGDYRNETHPPLTFEKTNHGDWTFDNDGKMLEYIVSGRQGGAATQLLNPVDRRVDMAVYQCYFRNCIAPIDGDTGSPTLTKYWSDPESWREMEEDWGGHYGHGLYGLPKEGDDLRIASGMWMVLDVENLPNFNNIYISGVLEFTNMEKPGGGYYNLTLIAEVILIVGGRLIIGTEEEPYRGIATVVLRGTHDTEEVLLNYGPTVGAKALGVFGGLDMHGTPTSRTWTKLSDTVNIGDNTITLKEPVDWQVGAEIVVTTTGMSPYEAETGRILTKSADGRILVVDTAFKNKHLAVTEHLHGHDILMASEVGLLSRNVRIVGESIEETSSQLFGGRVIVGSMLDDSGNYHQGYGKLSNVEFNHGGQEGYTESYDPRLTLAFLNIGDATNKETQSYVKECSFNWNYSPAIGVFGTNHLHVDRNVIYHTIGSSIIVEGRDTIISGNLIAEVYYPGAYSGRFEPFKLTWDAGIEINNADGHVHMYDNVVAGSERGGYHVDGQVCGEVESDPSLLWRRNEAHSVLIGVELLPLTGDGVGPCITLNGFKVWKAYDFGLYSQTPHTTKVTNFISVDNSVGVMMLIYGPSAAEHKYSDKYANIDSSIIVGTSSAFDCRTDDLDLGTSNMVISEHSRSWRTASGGKVGIGWSNFLSGSNNACAKPFAVPRDSPAIRGETTVSDTLFANFGKSCGDRIDFILTTNPFNEDFQHPISLKRITLDNVEQGNKVFIHRPDISKVNPTDCVDMDCDAKKKALLRDEDGSFLGSAGAAIIPQSEWEWDGDPRRGLGDYRIPKTLITDTDGNRLDVDTVAPHRGIQRDASCEFNSNFQAYQCNRTDYLNAQLESLDLDSTSRRISPVALLSDDGYLDLINGPQDHSWCSGFSCHTRLSTFPLTVATGHYYVIHYSATAPQNSRIHLLNADDTQAVVFGIWYSQPWRLDVSVGGGYVKPTNGYYDADGRLLFEAPVADEFMPDVTSDLSGTNYFDRAEGILHVLVRGVEPVTIGMSPIILVTFNMPAWTTDEFYGENIIKNIAAFYNIPTAKIRIAKAVKEMRKKRAAAGVESITFEISEPPAKETGGIASRVQSNMDDLSSNIIRDYQLGQMGDILGVEVLSMEIVEPPPDTSSDTWTGMAEEGKLSAGVELLIPSEMQLVNAPVVTYEGVVFSTPPVLQMLDPTNAVLSQVGSLVVPWVVEVNLLTNGNSDSQAILLGATSAEFGLGGTASFADLAISHSGKYALSFEVVSPAEASSFRVETSYFTVTEKVLTAAVSYHSETVLIGEEFEVSAEIIDSLTGGKVENIAWKTHSWTCTISDSTLCRGETTYKSNTTVSVNPTNNSATFAVVLNSPRMCPLRFSFKSTSTLYTFTVTKSITVYRKRTNTQGNHVNHTVTIKFDADFTHGSGHEEQIKAAVYNTFWPNFPYTTWSNITVYPLQDTVAVEFIISGLTSTVERLLASIRHKVASPLILEYDGPSTIHSVNVMYADGEEYQLEETAIVPIRGWFRYTKSMLAAFRRAFS